MQLLVACPIYPFRFLAKYHHNYENLNALIPFARMHMYVRKWRHIWIASCIGFMMLAQVAQYLSCTPAVASYPWTAPHNFLFAWLSPGLQEVLFLLPILQN